MKQSILLATVGMMLGVFAHAKEIEIGIVLLPDDDVRLASETLSKQIYDELDAIDFSIAKVANQPHISLFQMNMDESFLPALHKALATITLECPKMSLELEPYLRNTYENIFWDVAKDTNDYSILEGVFQTVVDKVANLRHPNLMRQLRNIELSKDDLALIERYGVNFGVPGRFNPHITICYDSGQSKQIDGVVNKIAIPQKKLTCNQLAIARLGFSGNVEEILASFDINL